MAIFLAPALMVLHDFAFFASASYHVTLLYLFVSAFFRMTHNTALFLASALYGLTSLYLFLASAVYCATVLCLFFISCFPHDNTALSLASAVYCLPSLCLFVAAAYNVTIVFSGYLFTA
jgi:hypothetical protein